MAKDNVKTEKNQSIQRHQPAKPMQSKRSYQVKKPSEEDANENSRFKNKNET